MEFLKELFADGSLSYDELSAKVQEKGFKLADLSKGEYVSKGKYDQLNDTLKVKEDALTNALKEAEKGSSASEALKALQDKYDAETKTYSDKLSQMEYRHIVESLANGEKFTSNAAKREFINEMVNKGLTLEDGKIVGADDYIKSYKEANSDSFVIDNASKPSINMPSTGGGNGGKMDGVEAAFRQMNPNFYKND